MNKPWLSPDFFIGDEDFDEKMDSVILPFYKENLSDGYLVAEDRIKLHYVHLRNPIEKGSVVISHGFCEFFNKYQELMYYFFQLGYSVFFIEHRGHGYSDRQTEDPEMVYVRDFEDYISDFDKFINTVVIPESSTGKFYLFAHSMGGAIGALYLEEHPTVFRRAVLSSPMIEMNYGSIPMFVINIILFLAKVLGWQKKYTAGQHGFDDKYVFEGSSALSEPRYDYAFTSRQKDKMYRTYGSAYGWVSAGKRATKRILKNTDKIKTPILLCQAGKDTKVKGETQDKFVSSVKDISIIKYPDSKHEIFNADKVNREKFYNDIFMFIEEQV